MGAIVCQVSDRGTAPSELSDVALFARGVNPLRERHCPHCQSVIYSRRHKLCGVCFGPLPESCTFSDYEAENVKSLLEQERERHRKWVSRINSDC